jgi:hypothetical protein
VWKEVDDGAILAFDPEDGHPTLMIDDNFKDHPPEFSQYFPNCVFE